MLTKNGINAVVGRLSISRFDFIAILLFCVGGFLYSHNPYHWSGAYVGDTQYGDAEFWWSCALHVANGIFRNNPGLGFHPGYFLLTGVTLPVLGLQFEQFYPYFLVTFLVVCSLFYLALRHVIGRYVSAGVVAMIIFNPFTTQWLSTTTSDALGLLLQIAALTCLLQSLRLQFNRSYLMGFALFFSLATLTRPLMTLFFGIVLLILFIFDKSSIRKRLTTISVVLIVFCVPLLSWMIAQKMMTNDFTLSDNAASTFYAASDSKIQVWASGMYNHIDQLAKEKYHVSKVTEAQENQVFLQETIKNYIGHPVYQLERILPNVWTVANFSPIMAQQGTDEWRVLLLMIIALGLALKCVTQRFWIGAGFLLWASCGIYLSTTFIAYMTIVGAVVGLFQLRPNRLPIFLLSVYWWVGVLALYLVGGSWGQLSFGPLFAMNALGFRLGSQFFFMGDILACYCLLLIANNVFGLVPSCFIKKHINNSLASCWNDFTDLVSSCAQWVVASTFALFFSLVICVFLIGISIVIYRSSSGLSGITKPYPALDPVIQLYEQHNGNSGASILLKTKNGGLSDSALTDPKTTQNNYIFTGIASPFIWNFPGQQRAQMLLYAQNQMSPFTMGPNYLIVEVPEHVRAKNWVNVQGAFIVQHVLDNYNTSSLPYYLTTPKVRAFVPISADGHEFALQKARWFALQENATELYTNKKLHIEHAAVKWSPVSGAAPYQRRFLVTPDEKTQAVQLDLSMQNDHKKSRILSFGYVCADPSCHMTLSTNESNATTLTPIAVKTEQTVLSDKEILEKVNFAIPVDVSQVKIMVDHLKPHSGVWFYEFNVTTSN